MNSIHFHFNGDVNINVSLPDGLSALAGMAVGGDVRGDAASYQRLVDSLEDYLHGASPSRWSPPRPPGSPPRPPRREIGRAHV